MTQPWIDKAYTLIGLTEVPGPTHNQKILEFWRTIKRGGIQDDETPWCAAFVGYCLEKAQIRSTRFEGAKSYLTWGQVLKSPVEGCVVVFGRESGGGHVGFVVGKATDGDLLVLGGNQNNRVSIAKFKTGYILGFRYPEGYEPPDPMSIPIMGGSNSDVGVTTR